MSADRLPRRPFARTSDAAGADDREAPRPTLPATLADGSQATLVSLEGELLGLTASRPFAPGQPVELTACLDSGVLKLAGKTLSSRRREDGAFDVRLRLVNLRKRDRETLASTV